MDEKIWKVVPYALMFTVLSFCINIWRLPPLLRRGVIAGIDNCVAETHKNSSKIAVLRALTIDKVGVLQAMLGGLDGMMKDGCINIVIKDRTDRKGNTTRTVFCE